MGFWSSLVSGSAIARAFSSTGSSSSTSEKPENDPTYKKYAAEIHNFELDPKLVKKSVSSQKENVQLSQKQDGIEDIDSIDDVKKHFQD